MGRRAIVLLVALILAGLAAWAVWNFMQNLEGEVREGQAEVTVFRAGTGGIAEGTEGNILISQLDSGAGDQVVEGTDEVEDTPADAIETVEELRQVLTNRVAAGPISEDGILTRSQWTEVTVDVQPLAEQIASGNQAITISASNIEGVNGFVEAGDRINMIVTLPVTLPNIPGLEEVPTLPQPEDEEPVPGEEEPDTVTVIYTRYVLQGLNVLAAGRNIRPEEEEDQTGEVDVQEPTVEVEGAAEGQPEEELGNSTVFTLEVTPDQAERIVYASQNGSIWLTLVPEDFVEVESDGVTIDNLFGGDLQEAIFPDN